MWRHPQFMPLLGRYSHGTLAVAATTQLRFYALIPHNFGLQKPPPIDNQAVHSCQMLEADFDVFEKKTPNCVMDYWQKRSRNSRWTMDMQYMEMMLTGLQEVGLIVQYFLWKVEWTSLRLVEMIGTRISLALREHCCSSTCVTGTIDEEFNW